MVQTAETLELDLKKLFNNVPQGNLDSRIQDILKFLAKERMQFNLHREIPEKISRATQIPHYETFHLISDLEILGYIGDGEITGGIHSYGLTQKSIEICNGHSPQQ